MKNLLKIAPLCITVLLALSLGEMHSPLYFKSDEETVVPGIQQFRSTYTESKVLTVKQLMKTNGFTKYMFGNEAVYALNIESAVRKFCKRHEIDTAAIFIDELTGLRFLEITLTRLC